MSGKAALDKNALPPPAAWPALTVAVSEVPVPLVTDPGDAVIRVTSTAICGSDLHLYEHAMPGMKPGDVLGHEFMGVVEEVGSDVKKVQPGDRVVVAFDIACGACFFCKKQPYSSCAASNPSHVQEAVYGQASGGFFGYSHLTGGWQGGQAEYVRVPVGECDFVRTCVFVGRAADVNVLKVPRELEDEQVVLLSDILPTAWHACELDRGVGILAAHCALHRGARRVILIDAVQYRLDFAAARPELRGVEVLNRNDKSPLDALKELCKDEPGGAPDVVVDAVGMHYATSLLHKVQVSLQLETDTPEIVNECVRAVRKGGRVAVVGAYAGFVNAFQLGAFMEKQLTIRGGQTPVQARKYWHTLLDKIQSKALNPGMVITHLLPLEEVAKGYDIFNSKRPADGCVKVVLKTAAAAGAAAGAAGASAGVGPVAVEAK
ncbi:MAG: GroES-like protein [Monoraphidium minutum]|nr:MAG: GroES-like protein [Monoraphidium minutum]